MTSTKPLVLVDGTVVRDLVVRFEGGRVSGSTHPRAARRCETIIATDDGAARLGEVALVDREGRIGELGTIFYDTLLDENAASHIALGQGFPFVLDEEDRERSNESRDPHRLHDRLRTSSRSPGSPRRASACRCWSRAAGRSERLPFQPSRRGAGAAERARLEIV